MSSMWRIAWSLPLLLGAATASSAQYAAYAPATAAASVSYAIGDWRRLRQSNGYALAHDARFLIANPNWPEEAKLRGWAEKAIQPGENANTVLAFFATKPPTTGNGFAALADAFAAAGRTGEALAAARSAWGEA